MSQTASQALARKWRPKDFESLVGQEHVVQALSHALQTQRLHHAYLLTGTRGVGKTTIARILAKAVNCEEGVSAKPCGVCRACTEIAQGRFVDLLEVDAATNTRVDEMRQLLENAAYAPTAGRYKVYVIDEVHMLSNSSFNAMLKTLEEPPEHILFVLATTDPQKIPPTVLSRCLQFGLRQLAPDQIFEHLSRILQQENLAFEPGALRLLGKAARGSLRDALSLTDQAIAFSAGQLSEQAVRDMLGSVDQQVVVQILQLLADRDGAGLNELSQTLAAQSAPFASLLDELAAASYRLSVAQLTGGLNLDDPDQAALQVLQGKFSGEDLQLFYQIAVHARAELHLAPEEVIGFSMALIRMMSFRPGGQQVIAGGPVQGAAPNAGSPAQSKPANQPISPPASESAQYPTNPPASQVAPEPNLPATKNQNPGGSGPAASSSKPAGRSSAASMALAAAQAVIANRKAAMNGKEKPRAASAPSAPKGSVAGNAAASPPEEPEPAPAKPAEDQAPPPWDDVPPLGSVPDESLAAVVGNTLDTQPTPLGQLPTPEQWPEVAQSISATGLVRQALVQSEWVACEQDGGGLALTLRTPVKTWTAEDIAEKLAVRLGDYFGHRMRVSFEVGPVTQTASLMLQAVRQDAQEKARVSIDADPFVQQLERDMGAKVLPDSVRPLHSHGPADV